MSSIRRSKPMTIRWCAYCQHFLGEAAPFETFTVSHGLCGKCAEVGLDISDADLEKAKRLQRIQEQLWNSGKAESVLSAAELIDDALAAGVRPIDLIMGFISPLLYRIGELWAAGEITVAEEHRYTAFCESILVLIEAKSLLLLDQNAVAPGTEVLLINADGNIHSLGIRVLALWFQSHSIRARTIYPGLPVAEIAKVVGEFKPSMLGISISLPEQLPFVREALAAIEANRGLNTMPQVVVGGYAVKKGMISPIPGVRLVNDIDTLLPGLLASRSLSAA